MAVPQRRERLSSSSSQRHADSSDDGELDGTAEGAAFINQAPHDMHSSLLSIEQTICASASSLDAAPAAFAFASDAWSTVNLIASAAARERR
mmetsp:Transcript_41092/g.101841  ORF Transcript_41092/g.101841 Transcript_41092/m.101841 type:complete len:92 (-) Transcript_41092:2290-2565(-)